MAGKIKTLPKVLLGLIIVGALAYVGNKALDKLPSTPTQIDTHEVVAPPEVSAHESKQPAPTAPVVQQPQPAAPAPAKADAFDAFIHEAGKK
jgi:hypothetical protein